MQSDLFYLFSSTLSWFLTKHDLYNQGRRSEGQCWKKISRYLCCLEVNMWRKSSFFFIKTRFIQTLCFGCLIELRHGSNSEMFSNLSLIYIYKKKGRIQRTKSLNLLLYKGGGGLRCPDNIREIQCRVTSKVALLQDNQGRLKPDNTAYKSGSNMTICFSTDSNANTSRGTISTSSAEEEKEHHTQKFFFFKCNNIPLNYSGTG